MKRFNVFAQVWEIIFSDKYEKDFCLFFFYVNDKKFKKFSFSDKCKKLFRLSIRNLFFRSSGKKSIGSFRPVLQTFSFEKLIALDNIRNFWSEPGFFKHALKTFSFEKLVFWLSVRSFLGRNFFLLGGPSKCAR